MDRFKARPLESLQLTSRPLSPHALAWSCDAELAVATADCIYVFLPEYLSGREGETAEDATRRQFALSMQPSAILQPSQGINTQLFAQAGIPFPQLVASEDATFRGVGGGALTGSGAALGQVIRVEWSPNGLGSNLRPVLLALTTTGALVAFGEHNNHGSTMTLNLRTRGFKNWKMLWGLGAKLAVPDKRCEGGVRRMNERIVSFSWAKEIASGKALLAYTNDAGEIVVMSIQYFSRQQDSQSASEEEWVWDIRQLARFYGKGPHEIMDPLDPDFIPHGSIFSLKWSPWLVSDSSRTATLAYTASNHVGFRKITLTDDWQNGQRPKLTVERYDTTTVCVSLSADAFIEWEDVIWPEEGAQMARGVIATPFTVKPFQVALDGPLSPPLSKHSARECSALYAAEDDSSTNPITGIIVHHPDREHKPSVPWYSLVRLSATAKNLDWFQTTLPEEVAPFPQWAETISEQAARLVSRATALDGVDSDDESESESDHDPDIEMDKDNNEPAIQVHPHRFRFWGLASSPGDRCTAVLATKHSTQHPDRRGLSTIHFGWQISAEEGEPQPRPISRHLTTEGRAWEWMYGLGDVVPGTASDKQTATTFRHSPLRDFFKEVALNPTCVFCDTKMRLVDNNAVCENEHAFATCAASGIAIMAPGISQVCGVCKLRCLKVSELKKLAQELLGASSTVAGLLGEACGSCGGKFVA